MGEYLIVLNKDEDSVSIVDLDNGEVVKEVETGHNPHEIAVTPDGKKSYISCSLGNELDVMDNDGFEIVKRIEHEDFDFPHGVGISGDGRLFLASTYSSMIFVVDAEKDEIVNHFQTGQKHSHMITFSSDGEKVFVPNIGSDNVTVLDAVEEEVIDHFDVGGGPEGTAFHSESGRFYVANQKDGTLFVIDPEDYEVEFKRRLGTTPIRIVFSPDEKYALIPNRESNDVSVIQTDFERDGEIVPWEIKRIPVGVWPGGTAFDSEGKRAYVANNKTNDVSVIDVDELKEIKRIPVGIHPDGMAYLKK